ncbi:MAG TPA: hypothetical protein PKD20_04265, partial [Candidatus Saccharibacteria bacterium]|nr:hypothetical protein [Candidatus Saccharibacteria bacterium]
EDDNRNVLQNRLNRFREKVLPVIEFYRNSGLLIEIDGSLEKSFVTGQILRGLYEKSLGI